jgi:hypothetical protein
MTQETLPKYTLDEWQHNDQRKRQAATESASSKPRDGRAPGWLPGLARPLNLPSSTAKATNSIVLASSDASISIPLCVKLSRRDH